MPFTSVPAKKASFVCVAEQISAAIEKGEFSLGQMLPPERELCQEMGVSRPVMREALSALQLLGIVQTRAGLGTFVGTDARHDLGAKVWSLVSEQSPGEVMETRMILEPAAARLAAARLTPHAAQPLDAVLHQMRALEVADVKDAEHFGSLDLRFHQAVADASQNSVISGFMKVVVGYSKQRLWRAIRETSYRYSEGLANRYLAHHERTYACLVSGDGDGAAQSMREHLEASTQAALAEMDAIGSRES